jgi:hypothetical protein
MALSDTGFEAFIVRIWLEETAEEAGHVLWRGHVTHVASGVRRALSNLEEIAGFIAAYIDGTGVAAGGHGVSGIGYGGGDREESQA